ncbi:MAG: tRNA (adenosine(37)-N6)-threonylcarbamoyltransferase complex ATPase subunit type 1 TsaE [Pontiellaceae bacterium]|nr:tRNA (adenosine(37)-N6)-threonylcarbamoyltransferase complex ATPase subunit type 1 TsaE [Pontiellaceae bacterium]MBN2785411.1 tRNA (adenosine(37)-N6)-threonylcarbamoyltransferase complex ATPase subunit type 1 TsaE [Pontiellaceae bacterium]
MRIVKTNSPDETWALAAELADELDPGTVMALHGDLGAGKTCFIQGLAAALGIDEPITSPTYTLIGEYEGRLPLHHIDLYRLSGPTEALGLGLEEYFDANGITAIEWAERADGLLPSDLLHICIEADEQTQERTFRIFREGEA